MYQTGMHENVITLQNAVNATEGLHGLLPKINLYRKEAAALWRVRPPSILPGVTPEGRRLYRRPFLIRGPPPDGPPMVCRRPWNCK